MVVLIKHGVGRSISVGSGDGGGVSDSVLKGFFPSFLFLFGFLRTVFVVWIEHCVGQLRVLWFLRFCLQCLC